MKHLIHFNNFLNEGRGIPNVVKEYVNIIYQNFINNNFDKIENDSKIIIFSNDNKDLAVKDLCIRFIHGNKNGGLMDTRNSNIINKIVNGVIFNINYTNVNMLREILTHEFVHLKEYYEFDKNRNNKSIQSHIDILNIKKDVFDLLKSVIDINDVSSLNEFFHILYLTLDTELNARIGQLYENLIKYNSNDSNFLLDKIKNDTYHDSIWKSYLMIHNFDSKKFVNSIITEYDDYTIIAIANLLNKQFVDYGLNKRLSLLKSLRINIIEDINGVYNFFNILEKMFHIKADTHLKRINRIIKEVVYDVNKNNKIDI